MERLAVAAVLVVIALAVAFIVQRRKPEPPTQARWSMPTQLDRADFEGGGSPWLLVVFTSETCASCAKAWAKAEVLASAEVAVVDVSWQTRPDLHTRYNIEAAPTLLVADADGVVCASFTGTPSATDLWAAVAEARET